MHKRRNPHPADGETRSNLGSDRQADSQNDPHASHGKEELAQRLAEHAIRQATGDDEDFEQNDETLEAEIGGPFEPSDAATELDFEDEDPPRDTEPEALPTAMGEAPRDPEEELEEMEEEEEEEEED